VEPVPDDPAMGAARALAKVLGEGVIRCELPPDAAELRARGDNLHHVQIEGTMLTAVVHDGEGRATVHRQVGDMPRPPARSTWERDPDAMQRWVDAVDDWGESVMTPALVVDWWDAGPGEVGSCAVSVPEPVVVRGRVVGSDGEPSFGAVVGGGYRRALSDRSGAFELKVTLGTDCHLQVSAGGEGHAELWFTPTSVH
jgi:hypothetical protein